MHRRPADENDMKKKKKKKRRVSTQTCMLPHLSAGKDSMSHVMKVTSIVNFALPAQLPCAHGSSSVFLACFFVVH